MIRLTYAEQLPNLISRLAFDLKQTRQKIGHLTPLSIIVENRAIEAYVRQSLADQFHSSDGSLGGAAAHLDFTYLRRFLDNVIEDTESGLKAANSDTFTLTLLSLLDDNEHLNHPSLNPVLRYVSAPSAKIRAQKQTQLALRLGLLWDDYILSCPKMIQSWRSDSTDYRSTPEEIWQSHLFNVLVSKSGSVSIDKPTSNHPIKTWLLPDILTKYKQLDCPKAVFLFNPTLLSPLLAQALNLLSQNSNIYLYMLSPCQEFWEDLPLAQNAHSSESEPKALQMWGHAGRDSIRQANRLCDWDFDYAFSETITEPKSILEAFRFDILNRSTEPFSLKTNKINETHSIIIAQAPSIRRECEFIAQDIWQVLNQEHEPPIYMSDIAIALGTQENEYYRLHLAAVFSEFHQIPFHELDAPIAEASPVLDAVFLLLKLPKTKFSRQDLLRLMTHPALSHHRGPLDTELWTNWCEQLSIIHGADHNDHQQTYLQRDLYNWDQGLKRLVLSTFLGATHEESTFQSGDQQYLPLNIPLDQIDAAGRMIALGRSLLADAKKVVAKKCNLTTWSEILQSFVSSYISAPTSADEEDLTRVQTTLRDLQHTPTNEESTLSYDAITSFIEHKLKQLTTHRGHPLADGVIIGSLKHIACIPAKVVYIPGLGEGQFPATDIPNPLDLRRKLESVSYVTPREQDLYNFLVRMLCTTDAIRLSYVARCQSSGDPISPSSALASLMTIIEQDYEFNVNLITKTIPVQAHQDPEDNIGRSLRSIYASNTLAIRKSLDEVLNHRKVGLQLLASALPRDIWIKLEQRLKLHWQIIEDENHLDNETNILENQENYIRIDEIRTFLEHPLRGWISRILELNTAQIDKDILSVDSEPFVTSPLAAHKILREVFHQWICNPDTTELDELYLSAAERHELRGIIPTGVFGESERKHHLNILDCWHKGLQTALQGQILALKGLNLGQLTSATAQETSSINRLYPFQETEAIKLHPTENRIIYLAGKTELLLPENEGSFILYTRPEPKDKSVQLRLDLRAFLDMAVLSSQNKLQADSMYKVCAAVTHGRAYEATIKTLACDEARHYLATIADQLLHDSHSYYFPLKNQLSLYNAQKKGHGTRKLQKILNRRSREFGLIKNLQVDPPSLDKAIDIVESRLKPLLLAQIEDSS